jgi:tetratricopeptide (TPR) repeat protein
VIALFALMQWGPGPAPTAAPIAETGAPAVTPPLPPELQAQVASLEDAIEAASTPEERFERRRELVELLVRAGAFARAGAVQEAIARATGDPLAWADAGSFYLAYMLRAEGPERSEYARRSAEAYEEALEQNPEDLDVKTDLATAYLNDPTNPMRAVEVVREVLDANPNHARARFNYGLMLAQIGRGEQARDQFEQVLALTNADDLVHERAREEIERIDALSPGASPPAGG